MEHDWLRRALEYDLQQEREFDYKGLSKDEIIQHLCRFTAGLWEIHPFCEGNTRTTAVFLIQYLRSMGFEVNNDTFAKHSWYFRNALVRANYSNPLKGVSRDYSFLEKFFRNLLLGENNELKNRYMVICSHGDLPSPHRAKPGAGDAGEK
jgi:fido (protein-threonine AMPylation protein)